MRLPGDLGEDGAVVGDKVRLDAIENYFTCLYPNPTSPYEDKIDSYGDSDAKEITGHPKGTTAGA